MSKTGPRAGTTVKAEVTSFLSRAPLKAFRRRGGSCVRLRELEPSVLQLRVSAPAAGEPPLTPPTPGGHRRVTAAPAPGAQGGLSPHGRPSPQRPRLSDGTPPPCPAPARAGRAQRQSEEARVRRARSASRPAPARRRGPRQPLGLGLPGPQEPLARPPRRAGVRRPTTGPLAGPHARAATCNLRGRPHPHPDYRLPAHEADFCCLPRAREPPRPEHPGTSFLSRWTESRCSLNSDTGAVSSLCVPLVKTPSVPRPVLRLRCLAGRSASHTPRPTGRKRPVPVRTAQPPAKSPPLFQQPFSGPQIPLRTELQIQLIPATAKQRRGSRGGADREGSVPGGAGGRGRGLPPWLRRRYSEHPAHGFVLHVLLASPVGARWDTS